MLNRPVSPHRVSLPHVLQSSVVGAIVWSFLALGLTACSGEPTPDPNLPPARADLGELQPLASWRTLAIDTLLEGRVQMGARSGFVALIARNGQVIHSKTSGHQDIEAGTPMSIDTRFHLASMTKPVVAVAAMILVEEGKMELDDLVSDYLPWVGSMPVALLDDTGEIIGTEPQTTPMKIRHLLSFSSGIAGASFEKTPLVRRWRDEGIYAGEGSLGNRVERLAVLPLLEQPGTKWRYGASLDVMAHIIERVAEEPLEVFMERRIFTPLGMHATRYPKDTPKDAPLAKMYTQDAQGDLVFAPPPKHIADDWTPGGSGLVSTAPDYMRFALMLWNEGEYDGVRILKKETVLAMRQLEVPSDVLSVVGIEGLGFGFGVSVVADASKAIMPSRDGDYWWNGAYGTTFWVSPSTGIVIVVLQQNKMSENGGSPVAPFMVLGLALDD